MNLQNNVEQDVEKKIEEKLQKLLYDLFRIDLENLDFGIYRIMNFKRGEIKKFIEEDLLKKVEKEFRHLYEEDRKDLEREIKNLQKKIKEIFGVDAIDENGKLNSLFIERTNLGKEYMEKLNALKNVENVLQDKIEIFSRIYDFFSRYYADGDLIPIRRYTKSNDYIIPYNGEEVILYWANKDQYYIKTTEYFQKYTFRVGDYEINFKLREAQIDKNNIKGKDKFFILSKENFLEVNGNIVNIYFEYRELTEDEYEKLEIGERPNKTTIKDRLIADAVERINDALKNYSDLIKQLNKSFQKKSGEKLEKTVLETHLRIYVTKNTKDYFIHKNLRKFFLTELDFYIKNEMLPMEDIEGMDEATLRRAMRRVRVFKNISTKIIEFLAEIEDFEKMLWEKKKFVLKTEYVITLDKIKKYAGEEFLEKEVIPLVLKSKEQLKEWKDLFGIEVNNKNDLTETQQKINGKEWKKLPIDTKYFDEEFKWKLLIALSEKNDLDEISDGVLIKSENFQALNLLLGKYREKIKTIYIDPPYNTGNDDFLYKDNYQHSSWLTMMENRLKLARALMKEDGVIFVSIDDNEVVNLDKIFDIIFSENNRIARVVWRKKYGGGKGTRFFVDLHEYLLCFVKSKVRVHDFWYQRPPEKKVIFKFKDEYYEERGKYYIRPLKSGLAHRPNLIYSITCPDGSTITTQWICGKEEFERLLREGRIVFKKLRNGKYNVYKKFYEKDYNDMIHPDSLIYDLAYNQNGKEEIKNLYGIKEGRDVPYENAKPSLLIKHLLEFSSKKESTILDFFAGSGTTAHAVMMLNKEDDGRRKFILVEMADYFDTVMVPRIKKVAYSFNWKDGKPQDSDGIGVFFKYHVLEQYEDTLNNIVFSSDEARQAKLREFFKDYIFHILEYGTRGSASRLNIDKFKKPFDYKMEILENGIPKTTNVDLVETFNYLLGLHIKKIYTEKFQNKNYVWVVGRLRNGSTAVVIWRDTENLDMKEDKRNIEENMQKIAGFEPDYIYVNSDSYVENAIPIESEFMKLMGA